MSEHMESFTPKQEPKSSLISSIPGLQVQSTSLSRNGDPYDISDLLSSDHAQPSSDDGPSLDEKELRRHLMDMESSFIPDLGHSSEHDSKHGQDDTYLELADPQTVSKNKQKDALDGSKSSIDSPSKAHTERAHSRKYSVDENGFTKPLIANLESLSGSNLDNSLSSLSAETFDESSILHDTQHDSATSSVTARNEPLTANVSIQSRKVAGVRPSVLLDRLPSLGSVASFSSEDTNALPSIARLPFTTKRFAPATPRPGPETGPPTDTVLAARVNSIQVPDTIARDFIARNPLSDKRPVSSDGPVVSADRHRRTLTLKEQNGKVDKLTKENFDLKLKIHFLDQALRSHSEEGVQELIDKNVQYQTDLANERKELQALRRKMREMERKAKEQADLIAQLQQAKSTADTEPEDVTLHSEMHQEILQLRQQLDHSENQLTTLREEMITEKYEKRKMAEQIRSIAGSRAEDTNGGHAAEVWEELLNAETGRREQAEEDLRKMKEELTSLRIEHASPVRNRFESRLRRGSKHASGDDGVAEHDDYGRNALAMEQLRQENADLRRDLGAQTSMLTSRNRERERLQQEIEDLKMLQRKSDGARSVAGDSIFDRSISRAHNRAPSRVSTHTLLNESERDDWDRKEGQLRDQNAELKLKFQELERTHTTHLQYISALEGDFQDMENELNEATEDLKALSVERDEALRSSEELQLEYGRLEQEALAEIQKLENDLQTLQTHRIQTQNKLDQSSNSYRGLQGELRDITQSVMNLEEEKQANLRNIEILEQQMVEAEEEIARWQSKCKEYDQKNKKLEVTGESLHSEVNFLREEQEGDKIKIGELEDAINAAHQTIQDEQEKMRELEDAILDERQQRDVLENQSKEEVQKVLDDLNNENARTKDEIRKLRRGLSAKEVEAASWKTKLEDLETAFRQALGETNGTKLSMLEEIARLQRDLENTANALDRAKMDHADKDRLLRHRDGLLESTSLESRRLSDLLDKERAARKHELDQFDKASRGQATHLRQIARHESRILELETGSSHDKRKMASLEQQYKEQLLSRNTLLLALWNRLSTLCGATWSQQHALVDGNVASIDVIAKNLPAFQRNVIAAIKFIEATVGGFKTRIRTVEKEMAKDFKTLEHNLEMRIRRMDGIERAVQETQAQIAEESAKQAQQEPRPGMLSRTLSARSAKSGEEHGKLKSEVKMLKAELKIHRQHPSAMAQQLIHQHAQMNPEHMRRMSRDSGSYQPPSPARQIVATLLRQQQHSSSAMESVEAEERPSSRSRTISLSAPQADDTELRWINRLKEMERRLKAEREGRLLDREGARQRLRDGHLENEELKLMLERERLERESMAMMSRANSSLAGDAFATEDGRHNESQ